MRLASFTIGYACSLSLFAALAACGGQVEVEPGNMGGGTTSGTTSTGLDIGAACTCAADAGNVCSSCGDGLSCFAPSMHSGVCTRGCTAAIDGGSDCPASFGCKQSGLDDYASGPWCL